MISTFDEMTPSIHDTAFISDMAHVIGNVRIGQQSSVWPGAVVRADSGLISIGDYTNIQDNSVIHADQDAFIGNSVTMGHGVICHAKRIGDASLIGNGSILNDGVVIGEGCLVAAGTVVSENTVIPDDMLVRGVPGEVVGKLRIRHSQLIRRASREYATRVRRYRRFQTPDNPI